MSPERKKWWDGMGAADYGVLCRGCHEGKLTLPAQRGDFTEAGEWPGPPKIKNRIPLTDTARILAALVNLNSTRDAVENQRRPSC